MTEKTEQKNNSSFIDNYKNLPYGLRSNIQAIIYILIYIFIVFFKLHDLINTLQAQLGQLYWLFVVAVFLANFLILRNRKKNELIGIVLVITSFLLLRGIIHV